MKISVATPGLHLRERPTDQSDWVDILTSGDVLEVIGEAPGWKKGRVIKTKSGKGIGQEGWVFAADTKPVFEPAPLPPPVRPLPWWVRLWRWLNGCP